MCKLMNKLKDLERKMILKEKSQQINKVFATLESYNKFEKKLILLDRHLLRAEDIDDDKY